MNPAERFPNAEATYAGKIMPEDLSADERLLIRKGKLGYCQGHRVLYRKPFLHACLVPMVFPDGLGRKCAEWPSGPKEWSPRRPGGLAKDRPTG